MLALNPPLGLRQACESGMIAPNIQITLMRPIWIVCVGLVWCRGGVSLLHMTRSYWGRLIDQRSITILQHVSLSLLATMSPLCIAASLVVAYLSRVAQALRVHSDRRRLV